MAAVLATLAEVKSHLGVSSTSTQEFPNLTAFETYLSDLMTNVEALLAGDCNVTFAAGATISNEAHDGTGGEVFYTDYPISTLTSVKVGIDVASPDETLTTIPDEISFSGSRVIRRGGVWPLGLKNLFVSYTSADYKPAVAKQAFFEGIAFLYRRRGKEHVASQTVGELGSLEAAARFDLLPAWKRAVSQLRVPVVV